METTQVSYDHLLWEKPTGEAGKNALRLESRETKILGYC